MPLFRCSKCGCVENTALSDFWLQRRVEGAEPKCSECYSGKWHGDFEKKSAVGYHIDQQGYLWSGNETSALPPHVKLVGVVPPDDDTSSAFAAELEGLDGLHA